MNAVDASHRGVLPRLTVVRKACSFGLRAGVLLLCILISSAACAQSPKLTGTSPLGVQRGKTMELTFRGSALAGSTRLVAPFEFRLEEAGVKRDDSSQWTARLTVDERTGVGIYPIRLVTDLGISNPLLFAVGQLPQIKEAESNNTFSSAQAVPNPVVIEGECAGNDEDYFRFPGHKGDRVVVDAVCARIGSGVDPAVRLTTAEGKFVASADDTPGWFTDGYLTAVLPQDGDYVVEFSDARFAGTGRAVYRLTVGTVPFAGEVYPLALPRGQIAAVELRGGTLSADRLFALRTPSDPRLAMFCPSIPARLLGDPTWADSPWDVELPGPVFLGSAGAVLEPVDAAAKLPPLAPPVAILGRLSKPGERDEFTIAAPAGSKHEVRVEAWGLGSALDGQLRVLDKNGKLLGESDDGRSTGGRRGGGGGGRAAGPASTDPAFDVTIPEGQREVRLVVKDLVDRGGVGFNYRVLVTPAETGFQLSLSDNQVPLPRGDTALIPVTVARTAYKGPIALEVLGVPPDHGLTIIPGTIGAGGSSGLVGLKTAAGAAPFAGEIQVVGKGDQGQVVAASTSVTFAEQTIVHPGFGMGGTIPSYARPFVSMTAATIKPGPLLIHPDAPKRAIPQGMTVDVPIAIERTVADKKKYKLVAIAPPAGISVAELEFGETGAKAVAKLTIAADAPVGPAKLALAVQGPPQAGGGGRRRGAASKNSTPAEAAPPPIAAAIVDIEVVRPMTFALTEKQISLRPGSTAKLKGKLTRAELFDRDVDIKLENLPPGVTADIVKVPANASEFTASVVATDKARAGETVINLMAVYKLGDKTVNGGSEPIRLKIAGRQ